MDERIRRKDLVEKLRAQTATYFRRKGYPTAKCGYILEKYADWKGNIIVDEVAQYIDEKKQSCEKKRIPFPLHNYIHHGLSSQACLFNLLGPILVSRDYSTLKEILSLSGLEISGDVIRAEFEYADRSVFNENRAQPTSVDLYIETNSNEKVFTEFKFTESGFGLCSLYEEGDCDGSNPKGDLNKCYLHGLGRTYMELMLKYDLLTNFQCCPFIEFYQAYRLLLFALEKDGCFLLIHDERNPAFLIQQRELMMGRHRRFKDSLPKAIADKVFILSIQKIVKRLEDFRRCNWLNEFKEKYL